VKIYLLFVLTANLLIGINQDKKIIKNKLNMEEIKFIDLFAGIGGTRLGFEKAGAKCVFSSEWDNFAQQTYKENFGEIPHGDINKIKTETIPDFDILVGGFPCQPFSSIGKRQGFEHPTQGTLFHEIVRILEEKKPISFLLENVKGLTNHDNGKTLKIILKTLKENYWVFYDILDSANFGVPQHRERIYLIGFRKNRFKEQPKFIIPKSNGKTSYINEFLEENAEGYSISEHLQNSYLFKKDDGRPKTIDKSSKEQIKTLVSTYHKIQRLTGTFVKDGKTGLRLFTENECKAIMGFPKEFKVPVSRTQMYRQFGNSVAVPVIEELAKKIIETIKNYSSSNKVINSSTQTTPSKAL
jgi:DNA (cytosine-5)-methyltransferase 1